MNDFSKAKIGQRVFSLLWGYGTIVDVNYSESHPIRVEFTKGITKFKESFTVNGYLFDDHFKPLLYWSNPEIIAPSAPPKTKLVNGIEIPDISFQPKERERYYFPKPISKNLYSDNDYNSEYENDDLYQAENGMCYPMTREGREAAILHAKAMLGIAD